MCVLAWARMDVDVYGDMNMDGDEYGCGYGCGCGCGGGCGC